MNGKNYSINGLRLILACFVVWNHCALYNPAGNFAVVAFFAITGMFLCKKKSASCDGLIKSIKRIFPHHFIALTLVLLLMVVGKKHNLCELLPSYLSYLTFTSMWLPFRFCEAINGVDWYLSAYIWIYLFLIILTNVNKGTKIALMVFYIATIVYLGINTSDPYFFFRFYAQTQFFDVLLGFLIYHAIQNDKISKVLNPQYMFYLSVILLVLAFIANDYIYDIFWLNSALIYFVPVFLLLYSTYRLDECDCIMKKILSNKFIQKGGDMSMCIFLYHFAVARTLLNIVPNLHPVLIFCITLTITVVISYLCNHVIIMISRYCISR